jgi:hypothetical protein
MVIRTPPTSASAANLMAAAANLKAEIVRRIGDPTRRRDMLAALDLVLEFTLDVMNDPAPADRRIH